MKKNMGIADRLIRILIAAAISIAYFTNYITSLTAIVLLVVGGILLLTSIISFCPIWLALGIKTNKNPTKE